MTNTSRDYLVTAGIVVAVIATAVFTLLSTFGVGSDYGIRALLSAVLGIILIADIRGRKPDWPRRRGTATRPK